MLKIHKNIKLIVQLLSVFMVVHPLRLKYVIIARLIAYTEKEYVYFFQL
jgi:hypothetical protein